MTFKIFSEINKITQVTLENGIFVKGSKYVYIFKNNIELEMLRMFGETV